MLAGASGRAYSLMSRPRRGESQIRRPCAHRLSPIRIRARPASAQSRPHDGQPVSLQRRCACARRDANARSGAAIAPERKTERSAADCPISAGNKPVPPFRYRRVEAVRDPGDNPAPLREPMRGITGEVKAETVLWCAWISPAAHRESRPTSAGRGCGAHHSRTISGAGPVSFELAFSADVSGDEMHVVSAEGARPAWLCAYDPSSRTGQARSISAHPGTDNVMAVSEARHVPNLYQHHGKPRQTTVTSGQQRTLQKQSPLGTMPFYQELRS